MNKKIGYLALVAAGALVLSSCSASPEAAPAPSAPEAGGSAAAVACDVTKVGEINRCENFYEDIWPGINEQLDALYAEAKKIDGGRLVIWDWYEQSPDVVAEFNARFPEIKIESEGMQYMTSSAIITAKTTGERNTDIVSGSITSIAAMYDEGYWDKTDWTSYGVPKEFLQLGTPEMMPDSTSSSLLLYNSSKTEVPASLDGLLDPQYKGKVSVQSWNTSVWAGYGMKHGEDKMVELIKKMMTDSILVLTDDQMTGLSAGDVPVALSQVLYVPSPELKATAFDESMPFAQATGVNSDATNKPAAILWTLWNAFDPDWINLRMTDDRFSSTAVPWAGLPASVFAKATGLMKTNADAILSAVELGNPMETMSNRDKVLGLMEAADAALGG